MFSVSQIALAGLHAAEIRANVRAKNIVNAYTPGYRPDQVYQSPTSSGPIAHMRQGNDQGNGQGQSTTPTSPPPQGFPYAPGNEVDLAAEFVDLKFAQTAYKAAIAVLKTGQEMEDAALELIA